MKIKDTSSILKSLFLLIALTSGLLVLLFDYLPKMLIIAWLLFVCSAVILLTVCWDNIKKRQLSDLANNICDTVDALMEGRKLDNYQPYDDSATSKVQGKLLQYYEKMQDGQRQNTGDKQTLQSLVSDISHQVKTPVANIKMFTEILKGHSLLPEKQAEFLNMMETQINKLDFLMQSLIKMSRLETGTFTLHMDENNLYQTITQAVSSIWAVAEQKDIQIDVDCSSEIMVKHDVKWTAEALGNLLDNAVKYTPRDGLIKIHVCPWQFYTRIDITDTGIGIVAEHYNDIFKRFYREQEVASTNGVGLGLYLTRCIMTRQKGYIIVKSEKGKGTTFSVFLLT